MVHKTGEFGLFLESNIKRISIWTLIKLCFVKEQRAEERGDGLICSTYYKDLDGVRYITRQYMTESVSFTIEKGTK